MNKIKAAIKMLLASEGERKKSMEIIATFFFEQGRDATMASYTSTHGFNKDMIEAKKQELLKQL